MADISIVSVWERVCPCMGVYAMSRALCVAFIVHVLFHSSSQPFKIGIITLIFQVGRLGLSKFNDVL